MKRISPLDAAWLLLESRDTPMHVGGLFEFTPPEGAGPEFLAETVERWREEIEQRSAATRWVAGGCANWYVNGEGINTNNWPGAWLEFRRRTRRIDPAEFELAA